MNQELYAIFGHCMTANEITSLCFLIDDYLEVFDISSDLAAVKLFEKLHQSLGTDLLLKLLSECFAEIQRKDLCDRISSYVLSGLSGNSPSTELPSSENEELTNSSLCEERPVDTSVTAQGASTSYETDAQQESLDNSGEEHGSTTPSVSLNSSPVHDRSHGSISNIDSGISAGNEFTEPSGADSVNLQSFSPASGDQELSGPIELPVEEIEKFFDTKEVIGSGGFGHVYKGKFRGKDVAIKQAVNVFGKERQFLKEKQLAFLRNTYIVPILVYGTGETMMMIVYPYMEGGDLKQFFNREKNLNWKDRVRILYQCSEGLTFLHKPVSGIRNEIVHGDVKPGNILLDVSLNARLGDVGVAVELPPDATHYTTTANMMYGTEGYKDPYCESEDRKHVQKKENDVFSLGIVALQLLKWQEAVQTKTKGGRNIKQLLSEKLFEHMNDNLSSVEKLVDSDGFVDKNIWDEEYVRRKFAEIVLRCLVEHKCRYTADKMAVKLSELLKDKQVPRHIYAADGNSKHKDCLYCCINGADELVHSAGPVLYSKTCPEKCFARHFCHHCYSAAFCNPLHCPEHGYLKQIINPEKSCAILISGSDDDDENQAIFDGDVEDMFSVITDPKVMGFSKQYVHQIKGNFDDKQQKIKDILEKIQKIPMEMLIIYYSGHGNEKKELYFSENDDKNMKDETLQELLKPISCPWLLVILDCCYAAEYKVKPDSENTYTSVSIQLNGAGRDKEGLMDNESKSSFTRYLCQAIKGAHICPLCSDKDTTACSFCVKFQRLCEARSYIDLYDVIGFCSEHLKLEAEMDEDEDPEPNITVTELRGAAPVARYNYKPYQFWFKFQNGDQETLYLKELKSTIPDVLRQLRNEISRACPSLPQEIDYRCLKLPGIVNARKTEILSVEELQKQLNRGVTVEVCVCTEASDLNENRRIAVFCSADEKFTKVLKNKESPWHKWLAENSIEENSQVKYSCRIRCNDADASDDSVKQDYDDEEKKFFGVLRDSVLKSNRLSNQLPKSGIHELKVEVMKNMALLTLNVI